MRHLTWRGKRSAIYYAMRRRFVQPAPNHERCIMGSVVDPIVHCPRRACPTDNVWCRRHEPKLKNLAPTGNWSALDSDPSSVGSGDST